MVLVGTSIYQIATFETNADGECLMLSLPRSYSANEDMPHLFQNTSSKPMVQFLHFYSHGCLVLSICHLDSSYQPRIPFILGLCYVIAA